jgi:hypothetical protein
MTHVAPSPKRKKESRKLSINPQTGRAVCARNHILDDLHASQRLLAIEQMQISRFNGDHGELFGKPISGELGTQ